MQNNILTKYIIRTNTLPYSAKQWQGENFGEFSKPGAICQSFTHSNNLYHKIAGIRKLCDESIPSK